MHMALRGNISAPIQVTHLVEASKDAASLLRGIRKKFFCFGGSGFFVSDVISGGLLGHLWPTLPGPGPKLLSGSISLKFLLETSRLQSKSFHTLDDLLGLQVQSL